MNLADIDHLQLAAVERSLQSGMAAWAVPEPMTLEEWAEEHFYLSAESSYVEQDWKAWPFQRAIMACISNDDIFEIDWKKSARVGYTKILLAAMAYFAEHKRRNQCIWQPTDDDAEAFVKVELNTMLRDCKVMHKVFPTYLQRHQDNTLEQKKFTGSIAYIKGGKAAKNYRRISIDFGALDEIDAFDNDIEKEGDPVSLAEKRLEGATFGKLLVGSTPKLRGFSLIDARHKKADHRFTYQIRCPSCGGRHPLTWGGKDEPHGFKWDKGNPDSVRHQCPHCDYALTQAEYLNIWGEEKGAIWANETGTVFVTADGRFIDELGNPVETPRHVAFHIWTAYSPAASWADIVRDFLFAFEKQQEGDDAKMKVFVNTTRGETWDGEAEQTDEDELKQRAEPFPLKRMPRDCLLLLCGGDTQGNRIELGVWGLGIGGQMWSIDHQVFFGNPSQDDVWRDVEEFLFETEYEHACGLPQKIYATAIDSGGHHADEVYAFAHKHKSRRVHAIKGASSRERAIDHGNSKVSYRKNGKIEKNGPILWIVGTNLAKDRFASRLEVTTPGPGYVHLSSNNSDEWFRQLAGVARITQRLRHGTESRWTDTRKRVEVRDCNTYAIWLEERLDLWSPRKQRWWQDLEAAVQPPVDDLFAEVPRAPARPALPLPQAAKPIEKAQPDAGQAPALQRAPEPRSAPIASSEWSSRL